MGDIGGLVTAEGQPTHGIRKCAQGQCHCQGLCGHMATCSALAAVMQQHRRQTCQLLLCDAMQHVLSGSSVGCTWVEVTHTYAAATFLDVYWNQYASVLDPRPPSAAFHEQHCGTVTACKAPAVLQLPLIFLVNHVRVLKLHACGRKPPIRPELHADDGCCTYHELAQCQLHVGRIQRMLHWLSGLEYA